MLSGRGIVRAILALILVLATSVVASIGDRSFKYQLCVFSCQQDTCRDHRPLPFTDDTIVASDPLPWYLVLTGWTCESNCEYHCTHRVTNEAQKRVQDIRSRVYAQLQQERDEAQALTLRWKKQHEHDLFNTEFDDLCEGDSYVNEDGQCIPRMYEPPPTVLSNTEIRNFAEAQIAKELSFLPPIDKQAVQFFGKWAQLRLMGMQEPFSVLFSALNLIVQLYAMLHLFKNLVPDTYPLKPVYRTHTIIASWSWFASSVFHTRDLWWTERWDYFNAAAVLVSGLFLCMCRILLIKPGSVMFRRVLIACVTVWVLHVLYLMSHWRLDYSYNMVACLMVGIVHNLLWLVYAFAPVAMHQLSIMLHGGSHLSWSSSNVNSSPGITSKQRNRLVIIVLLTFLAPGLELFDFPPLFRMIDAHALWHCATAPLTLYWYYWLVDDARECVGMRDWKLDHHEDEALNVDDIAPAASGSLLPQSASALAVPVENSVEPRSSMLFQLHNTFQIIQRWGFQSLRALRNLLIVP